MVESAAGMSYVKVLDNESPNVVGRNYVDLLLLSVCHVAARARPVRKYSSAPGGRERN